MPNSTLKKDKQTQKLTKSLFSELPYQDVNIVTSHSQFNNLLSESQLPTKTYLDKLHSLYDLDMFSLNTRQSYEINPDIQCDNKIRSNYYLPKNFNDLKKSMKNPSFSIIHNNVRSLQLRLDDLQAHLLHELNFSFDTIEISETKINNSSTTTNLNLNIPDYSFEYVPTPLAFGGVGMYINEKLNYTVIENNI